MANILPIFILLLILPLFFYKLGQSTLTNWDEAWYAEIARNILKTGELFNLYWNGRIYNDHPPAGFWLIALTFKIFGINDFWARFAPALAGFCSLIVLYFLGKELFNRIVGLASALALASSLWFLYRARSGNLDTFLVLFFLLSIFLAIKAAKVQPKQLLNKIYLFLLSISLGLLFLTKTLVPLTIVPVLALIFYKSKIPIKNFLLPLVVFLVIISSWFSHQFVNNPGYLQHYLHIGFPGTEAKTSIIDNLKLTKEYLHNGVGKWFWPGIIAIFSSVLLRQKRFLILSLFFITFFIPFLLSNKGHIWHLIPLHPIMILSFFGTSFFILEKYINKKVAIIFVLGFCLYFFTIQIRQIWYQFIDIPAYISDEAILSKESAKYPGDLYIDGSDFTPVAAFYSGKKIHKTYEEYLPPLFNEPHSLLLITYQWRLDQAMISKDRYQIIKSDRDKILVRKTQ